MGRWGDFAEGFNASYNTIKKVRQDYESRKIMEEEPEEFTTEAGLTKYKYGGKEYDKPLDKDTLNALRYERFANMYQKTGDYGKAMDYRKTAMDIAKTKESTRGLSNQNRLDEELEQANIEKGKAESSTAVANSQVATQTVDSRVGLSAANADKAKSDARVATGTEQALIARASLENQGIQARTANTQAGTQYTNARTQEQTRTNELNAALDELNAKVGKLDPAQRTEAWLEGMSQIVGPDQVSQLRTKFLDNELANIQTNAKVYAEGLAAAIQKNGLKGAVQYFDDVNTGDFGAKVERDPKTGIYTLYETDKDGNPVEVRGTGATPEELLENLQVYASPLGALGWAAYTQKLTSDKLGDEKTKADIGLTKARTVEAYRGGTGSSADRPGQYMTDFNKLRRRAEDLGWDEKQYQFELKTLDDRYRAMGYDPAAGLQGNGGGKAAPTPQHIRAAYEVLPEGDPDREYLETHYPDLLKPQGGF